MENEFADSTKEFKSTPEIFKSTAISAGELLNMEITPRERLTGSWMRGGDIGFIYGARGKGKTFFSLSLACALACGAPLHKWEISKARHICYVDGEMTLENIQYRIKLFSECDTFKNHAETLKKNFIFQHYENIADMIEGAALNLTNAEQQELLFEYCIQNKIEVLFLDNLSCLFRGMKENEADEWEKVSPFLLKCRKNKITVVIIHHAGKSGNDMRGTSKREDAIDWCICIKDNNDLKESTQGNAKEVNAIISFTKNREGTSDEIDAFTFKCLTVDNKMEIEFTKLEIKNQIIELIANGMTSCSDIAAELNMTKGNISKHVTALCSKGILKKENREYQINGTYSLNQTA